MRSRGLDTLARIHDQTAADDVLSVTEAEVMVRGAERGENIVQPLRDALTHKPWMSGAWRVLGDALFKSGNRIEAWDAWTIARRLDPDSRAHLRINERERDLVLLHPEYF